MAINELSERIERAGDAWVRLSAERLDGGGLRVLRLEVTTGEAPPGFEAVTWDYGRLMLGACEMSGEEAAGLIGSGGITFLGERLTLDTAESAGSAYYERLPSHADHDRPPLPWPQTRLRISGSANRVQPGSSRFVVGPGAPSFPSYDLAVEAFFHGSRSLTPSPGYHDLVVVRLTDLAARLERLVFASGSVEIVTGGTEASGCRVELSSPLGHHDAFVDDGGRAVIRLPEGVPREWWAVLSRGNRWLDFRHVSQYGRAPAVGVEYLADRPDPDDELSSLMFGGEGPTTEFKSQLPETGADKRRVARTVAAFANCQGGVVLFGVDRDEVTVVGVAGAFSEVRDRLNDIVAGNLVPRPPIEIRSYPTSSGLVVGLHVGRGDTPPYGVGIDDPRYYIRRVGSTLPARPDEVAALIASRQPVATTAWPGSRFVR